MNYPNTANCQTSVEVLRLEVDFVFPLSQQQEHQEQQPPPKSTRRKYSTDQGTKKIKGPKNSGF